MNITVNNEIIETDDEGFLCNPEDWNEEVMEALIAEHEKAGHKPVGTLGRAMILYFRDYYDDHMRHPTMREMVLFHARKNNLEFRQAEKLRDLLYELFPHGPVPMLAKLAGLPRTPVARELEG